MTEHPLRITHSKTYLQVKIIKINSRNQCFLSSEVHANKKLVAFHTLDENY